MGVVSGNFFKYIFRVFICIDFYFTGGTVKFFSDRLGTSLITETGIKESSRQRKGKYQYKPENFVTALITFSDDIENEYQRINGNEKVNEFCNIVPHKGKEYHPPELKQYGGDCN